ncbi:MAG TPA: Calx-beta domain-containing protein [Pyrinomonadaceae bacterium]|nr:Calx-beta domain-containing protein [Pyrinomonadaceae bacterium]
MGDLNGDGKLDLVTANLTGQSISSLLGDGAGGFSPAPGSPFSVDGALSHAALADFNSDGKLDVATISTTGTYVLPGNGAGGFTGSFDSASKIAPLGGWAVLATDLSGDGKADIGISSFGSGFVRLLGDGAGGFGAAFSSGEPRGSVDMMALAVGDLDEDGKLDVAAAGSRVGAIYFKGDGAGSFGNSRSFVGANNPSAIALADFNGDGKLDMATAGPNGGAAFTSISILLSAGGGAFEAARAFYTDRDILDSPIDLALADFNADGRLDFAALHKESVTVLLADAAGGYSLSAVLDYFPSSSFSHIISADFNKDGKADVAITGTISQPFAHVVSVSFGSGDGTFSSTSNVNLNAFTQQPMDLATGDFNGDSNPDIVVASRLNATYTILLGNGSGGFSIIGGQSLSTNVPRVAVADLNGDSKQDLVITDFDHRQVLRLLGDGTGRFGAPLGLPVAASPTAVAVGDFNLDGKPDIAAAGYHQTGGAAFDDPGTLSVLLGDGAGGFGSAVNYKVGATPQDMLVRDFDGDGKLDIVVVNQGSNNLSVLAGLEGGVFGPSVTFPITGGPAAVEAHDFNADGRLDLVLALPGARALAILTGVEAAPLPCLSVDDLTVTEGDTGSATGEVTVRLSEAATQTVKVNYMLRSFPAAAGLDFTDAAGTLTFLPGETSKTVSVAVLADLLDEDPETFTLHLSGPLNARIADGVARITIADNDPPPSVSIGDATVTEVDFNSNSAVFTVTLSGPSSHVVKVDYSAASGTATAGSDFGINPGTLLFGPGVTSMTISVPVVGDNVHEPDETFFVNLSNPVDATLADAQGQGTIINNDPVPSVTVQGASGSESPSGDTTASVSVRLSNPSSQTITVNYASADGTATAGSDYVAANGALTFNPGETQKTVTFTIKDDAVDETHETFVVNLSDPVNATVATGQASVTIFDNDGPAVSVDDITVTEGQSGLTSATFTLSLSAPSPQTVAVFASTANGTATATAFPNDYQRVINRSVVFQPGATTATVTVSVIGDGAVEPDETFFLNLSNPQDCTIADGQGVATIVNDDATIQFGAASVAVSEAARKVSIEVTRTGPLTGASSVGYSTADGTASERSDYNTTVGTLQFAPGEGSKTITVLITDDAIVEGDETFSITLSNPFGGATGATATAAFTINSDDTAAGPNPLDASPFFVRQHYVDFFSREPDAPGLAHWTNVADNCGETDLLVCRINVSGAFFLSIEFQQTGYLVERIYKSAYGDATGTSTLNGPHQLQVPVIRFEEFIPDTQRIGRGVVVLAPGWEEQLEANKQAFMLDFVQRQRFVSAFPSAMTPEQFVDRLNQRAGNPLDASERAALIAELGANNTLAGRASVLRKVAEDATLADAERNRAFVLMQYFGYLRRDPNEGQDTDHTGYEFWLGNLEKFGGNFVQAELVKAFILSEEYRKRFGQ